MLFAWNICKYQIFFVILQAEIVNGIMSPIFIREKGYAFKIYSNEEERMHVHVVKEEKEAKFWLEPKVEVATKGDFKQHEINQIQHIVEIYAEFFKKQYQLHIGGRVDD